MMRAVGLKRMRNIKVRLLTNLRTASILNGSLDVSALKVLHDRTDASIASFEPLHAKAFVVDGKTAIVGSANLTFGGLERNAEIGVVLKERDMVRNIAGLLNEWFSLADPVERDIISELEQKVQQAQEVLQRLRKEQKTKFRKIAGELDRVVSGVRDSLLANKTLHKSENQIFSEAILFALKQGPATTSQINACVQAHYPELCDDSIDRVINGVHFGKRWKHCVRNAQQHLKRNSVIRLEGKQWTIVS